MNALMDRETGQGLVEYALIIVLVAVVAIVALGALGPETGEVFSKIASTLNFSGPLVSVSAERSGHDNGNSVVVSVAVSESTSVTATDSQSGQSITMACTETCQGTIDGVGFDAGSVTVTAGGGSMSTSYAAKN
mgnify:CR=1 FL=1